MSNSYFLLHSSPYFPCGQGSGTGGVGSVFAVHTHRDLEESCQRRWIAPHASAPHPPPPDGMLCFLLPGWLLSLHGRHLPDGRSVGRRETGPSSDICTSGPFRPLQELPSKPHMRCSLSLDYPSRRLPPPPPSFPPANSNPLQNLFYFFVLSSLEASPGPPSPSSLGFPSSPTWIPLF